MNKVVRSCCCVFFVGVAGVSYCGLGEIAKKVEGSAKKVKNAAQGNTKNNNDYVHAMDCMVDSLKEHTRIGRSRYDIQDIPNLAKQPGMREGECDYSNLRHVLWDERVRIKELVARYVKYFCSDKANALVRCCSERKPPSFPVFLDDKITEKCLCFLNISDGESKQDPESEIQTQREGISCANGRCDWIGWSMGGSNHVIGVDLEAGDYSSRSAVCFFSVVEGLDRNREDLYKDNTAELFEARSEKGDGPWLQCVIS